MPDIPRAPLLGELARKEVAIARSDREKEAPDREFLVKHGSYIEAVIPLSRRHQALTRAGLSWRTTASPC